MLDEQGARSLRRGQCMLQRQTQPGAAILIAIRIGGIEQPEAPSLELQGVGNQPVESIRRSLDYCKSIKHREVERVDGGADMRMFEQAFTKAGFTVAALRNILKRLENGDKREQYW
jgi:hypothetical protein